MSDVEGILMIYLIDLEKVFENNKEEIPGLSEIKNSLNTNIPLIGYAIGTPPINGDIGGIYYVYSDVVS